MVQHLLIVYDKVDKSYTGSEVIKTRSIRSAARSFNRNFENDPNIRIEEFDLYHFGDFDDETGVLTPIFPPNLINVKDVKPTVEEEELGVDD